MSLLHLYDARDYEVFDQFVEEHLLDEEEETSFLAFIENSGDDPTHLSWDELICHYNDWRADFDLL
jgi:hypothetical protein